jgi:hypothetical protein
LAVRTARQLHALVTLVGLFAQLAAQVGMVAVTSVVYVEQKGMADKALRRTARRQLSAEQSRLSKLTSSGAGVGSGIARTGWSDRASKLAKTRMCRIISILA